MGKEEEERGPKSFHEKLGPYFEAREIAGPIIQFIKPYFTDLTNPIDLVKTTGCKLSSATAFKVC